MKFFGLFLIILVSLGSSAGEVDTADIYSNAMYKSFKAVVIKPRAYEDGSRHFPVVYLLHGWSGNYSNWIAKVPSLKDLADKLELIIVCPDGHYSSWYFNSPVDSAMRYETYIGTEVPAWIDDHYRTIKSRKARAITGLSMGGHGALFISLRHPQSFAVCGSMSGGVDLSAVRNRFDVLKRLGDTITHADNWKEYSVINMFDKYRPGDSLSFIIDCGTEDFFYDINHSLHEKLLRLKIPHDYIERPGKHDWNYWGNAVRYQLLFFRDYFNRKNGL
jgi:S-formylglutathione hydrolase FrmB